MVLNVVGISGFPEVKNLLIIIMKLIVAPNHTFFYSPASKSAASIILRGANDFMVDEMERSVHDALCVVKRVLESNLVVPGGGAVEAALSIYLETFATSIVSVYMYKLSKAVTLLHCSVWCLSCRLIIKSLSLCQYHVLT